MTEKKSLGVKPDASQHVEFLEVLRLTPFPAKGAVAMLRDSIQTYLKNSQAQPGSEFPTDPEVAAATQLSRSTVWRALSQLQREGWLIREPGRGSFVGPRASLGAGSSETLRRDVTRMAFLIANINNLSHDWFTPEVLRGVESCAEDYGVRCELLGQREHDIDTILRRLSRSKPDVLVVLAFGSKPGLVARDTEAMGIPLIRAGRPHAWPDAPHVDMDNQQGARIAVERLQQAGHRRIGLLMTEQGVPWVVQRIRGYAEAMSSEVGPSNMDLIHWMWVPHQSPRDIAADALRDQIDGIKEYLERVRPSAVICSSSPVSRALSLAADELGLDIPNDLSVVTFDQNPLVEAWFGRPITTVRLPLFDMGQRLTELATRAARGEKLPAASTFAFDLVEGDSVSQLPE
ncbi:MAG: LacI family DNA-binding transcriptional regulator [Planctomycetota bacterium]